MEGKKEPAMSIQVLQPDFSKAVFCVCAWEDSGMSECALDSASASTVASGKTLRGRTTH